MKRTYLGICLAGACAGAINGFLGAGGGMLLVPLLGVLSMLKDDEVFPASVCVILPVCVVSLFLSPKAELKGFLPYLLGSALGGLASGIWGKKIPVKWLHRGLGILILWGGVRYLW